MTTNQYCMCRSAFFPPDYSDARTDPGQWGHCENPASAKKIYCNKPDLCLMDCDNLDGHLAGFVCVNMPPKIPIDAATAKIIKKYNCHVQCPHA